VPAGSVGPARQDASSGDGSPARAGAQRQALPGKAWLCVLRRAWAHFENKRTFPRKSRLDDSLTLYLLRALVIYLEIARRFQTC
jgi:hypothetical protein